MAPAAAPIVVTGASGGLGWHLCRYFAARGSAVVGTYAHQRPELPHCRVVRVRLEEPDELLDLVKEQRWRAWIHAAALTKPDLCERQPELARQVNVAGTDRIGRHLAPSTPLIFLSTDLVFDGERGAYHEKDEPHPVNAYGRTKLAAERRVARHPSGVVVRLAKLYGDESPYHQSFESWIRGRLERGEPVPLFADEFRTPIYVGDVARALEQLIDHAGPHRLYHLGGYDRVSRLEFGRAYVDCFGLDPSLLLATAAASRGGVARGSDCSLDSSRFRESHGFVPSRLAVGLRKMRDGEL